MNQENEKKKKEIRKKKTILTNLKQVTAAELPSVALYLSLNCLILFHPSET